jgi:hypothetical protein
LVTASPIAWYFAEQLASGKPPSHWNAGGIFGVAGLLPRSRILTVSYHIKSGKRWTQQEFEKPSRGLSK